MLRSAAAATAVALLTGCTGSAPAPTPGAASATAIATGTATATTTASPSSPVPATGRPVVPSAVRVTADGRALVVATDQPCEPGGGFGARADEDATTVRLVVRAGVPAAYRMPCDATYYASRLHLPLGRPLAGRAVVDAATGRRLPVFRPEDLLTVTLLPAGFSGGRPFEHAETHPDPRVPVTWALTWDHDEGDMVVIVRAMPGDTVDRAHCEAAREVRARGRTMLACGWDADSQGGDLRWVEGGHVRRLYLGFAEAAGRFPYTVADARRVAEGLRPMA